MAKKTILVDDLDGSPADETVSFGLDGVDYTLDLTTANAEAFRALFKDHIAVATKAPKRKRSTSTTAPRATSAEIRAWAKDNGFDVPDRGRVPQEIIDTYMVEKERRK